jgi:hypothetical protein
MNSITPDLLTNTLNLIQLAHETAAAKGNTDQADRLAPVAENLRELVANKQRSVDAGAAPGSVTNQSDFQYMLQAVRNRSVSSASPTAAHLERTQVVGAMAAAGMNLMDIARQMGMTHDEVRLILDVAQKSRGGALAASV